jgi:uncharacterized oligopeptide transporter (OPT) family protein
MEEKKFQPFVSAETQMKEFTFKALAMGSVFGVLFGASTVYLALKAGLTVSASIPIAVLAITIGRKLFRTTILENNIIQTTGSASESIAAGVVFTLPGFLFLSTAEAGNYFNYAVIFILAIFGGMLGTLLMIPLRRSLIVKEHETLPYPEGTACASVLKAGEKGGDFAKAAFRGLGFAFVYALGQKMFRFIAETPVFDTVKSKVLNGIFPSAQLSADITPEYMGVGYIIGPKIAGVLVAGSILSWFVMQPLLASLIDPVRIAQQQVKLGFLKDVATAGGYGGWDPITRTFADPASAIYRAYIRLIGAGAVAMGGLITLIKTIPTIVSSFSESIGSVREAGKDTRIRTERDLSIRVVLFGSLALVVAIGCLSIIPGDSFFNRLLIGVLILVFGAFFVTVASRIVGIIGSSNSPVSGMTIATVMGTCLTFLAVGWSGKVYEPMALVVGGMVCIAASFTGSENGVSGRRDSALSAAGSFYRGAGLFHCRRLYHQTARYTESRTGRQRHSPCYRQHIQCSPGDPHGYAYQGHTIQEPGLEFCAGRRFSGLGRGALWRSRAQFCDRRLSALVDYPAYIFRRSHPRFGR